MINIYIRKDLNMRKGKMAAQSAHAAMKLLLESMERQKNVLTLSKKKESQLNELFKNNEVNITYSSDEQSMKDVLTTQSPFSIIQDNGRTEFHGVPTITCGASGLFDEEIKEELHVPQTYGTEIKAKQLFVYSKENPLSKENSVKLSVLLCLENIYSLMKTNEQGLKYIDLSLESELSAWITGAFGKIAVSVKKDEELDTLKDQLKENNIHFVSRKIANNECLVIEPKYPTNIDPLTKTLSLI